jgi:hypothetical protein
MLEHKQQVERNKHEQKEGNVACRRKSNVASMQTSLNGLGLGFLIRIVMTIIHRVV